MKFRKQGPKKLNNIEGHAPNSSTNHWSQRCHFCSHDTLNFPVSPAVAHIKHRMLSLAQFLFYSRKLNIVAATTTRMDTSWSLLICVNRSRFKVYGGCIQLDESVSCAHTLATKEAEKESTIFMFFVGN